MQLSWHMMHRGSDAQRPHSAALRQICPQGGGPAAMIVVVIPVFAAHAQACAFVLACCRRLPRWTDLPRSRINRPKLRCDVAEAAHMLQPNHQSAASTVAAATKYHLLARMPLLPKQHGSSHRRTSCRSWSDEAAYVLRRRSAARASVLLPGTPAARQISVRFPLMPALRMHHVWPV